MILLILYQQSDGGFLSTLGLSRGFTWISKRSKDQTDFGFVLLKATREFTKEALRHGS